jgi:hypothetical protein
MESDRDEWKSGTRASVNRAGKKRVMPFSPECNLCVVRVDINEGSKTCFSEMVNCIMSWRPS